MIRDLQFAMTNSAIGYEYAMIALKEEGEYGFNAEQIRADIDQFRSSYFLARERLHSLDSDLLKDFEADLQMQKLMLFAKQDFLHWYPF